MEQLKLQKRIRPEEPDDLRVMLRRITKVFSTKTTPTTATQTTTAASVTAVPQTVTLYNRDVSLAEVRSLNGLLNSYYGQATVYAVDFRQIFDSIQDDLVLAIEPYVQAGSRGGAGTATYEDILKSSMDQARRVSNPIVKGVDALPGVSEKLESLLKKDLLDFDYPNIQRTTLALIWSDLLLGIFSKWSGDLTSLEKRRIIKGGIALSLGIGVAFIQFCHKSPESITSHLRLLYEGYNSIRDAYNQRFERQLPDILRIESPRVDFARMTGHEKVKIGQVLNMVYTFRVGDMALSFLEENNLGKTVTEDICKKVISSVTPMPTQGQIDRIYKLYSRRHLYNLH